MVLQNWQERSRDTDSSARMPSIMVNCASLFINVNTPYVRVT